MKYRRQPRSRNARDRWRAIWNLLAVLAAAVVLYIRRIRREDAGRRRLESVPCERGEDARFYEAPDGEAGMDRSRDASVHVSRVRSEAIADRWIGGATLVVALAAIISMAASAPWQFRLAVVLLAVLVGPATPALRLLTNLRLPDAVVVGIGLDVALIMGIGQSLLLAHAWQPVIAFGVFVSAGGITGLLLLVAARIER